ncbi:MAG: hypothetical protein E6Q68_07495 [Polynucleobacter sp.]|nr:MAG: hypothetical protein E6Q68_07495 [Polynucleobacter sp.]
MNRQNLLLPGDLACPPSEVFVFRSFTFFARRMCDYTILVEVPWEFRDTYWNWFKENYLMDHIEDFVAQDSQIEAVRFSVPKLTCENLHFSLRKIGFDIRKYKQG